MALLWGLSTQWWAGIFKALGSTDPMRIQKQRKKQVPALPFATDVYYPGSRRTEKPNPTSSEINLFQQKNGAIIYKTNQSCYYGAAVTGLTDMLASNCGGQPATCWGSLNGYRVRSFSTTPR
jgi:hypothetical protein